MPLSPVLPFIADPNGLASNVFLFDDFNGNTLKTEWWDTVVTGSASVSIQTPDSTFDGGWLVMATGATGSSKGLLYTDGSVESFRSGELPVMRTRVRTDSALTVMRCAFALHNDDQALGGLVGHAGAEWDSVDSTTAWMFMTSDGAAQSQITSSASLAVSTTYDMMIALTTSKTELYQDGQFMNSKTTNIPGGTIMLKPVYEVFNNDAFARSLYCDYVLVYMNRA